MDRPDGAVVTYGENGGAIRAGLTKLLRQHRVQQHLGDNRRPTTSRTNERRQEYVAQIRRYRQGVLTWCRQAMVAADPYLGTNEFFGHHNSKQSDGPYDLLRAGLERAIATSTAPLPPLQELSKPHENELVETWRQIAAAAAIGEHDFHAGAGHGMLTADQCHTVLKDVAAIVQALVILDHRYAHTPGWEKLRSSGWLGWNALATGLEASIGPPDYTVDHRGWRPPLRFIRGPARPGILGVLQAEQNLLVRLTAAAAPINLRLAVSSQMVISAALAARTTDVDIQHGWQTRAETYKLIGQALRDVHPGHASHGAAAAQEANNIIARIADLSADATLDNKVLAAFDKRFTALDGRLADLIENGIRNNVILRRTKVARIDAASPAMVKPVRRRVAPMARSSDAELLSILDARLRPFPTAKPPLKAADSRADLYAAIVTEAPSNIKTRERTPHAATEGHRSSL